jgi:hypothetical protein
MHTRQPVSIAAKVTLLVSALGLVFMVSSCGGSATPALKTFPTVAASPTFGAAAPGVVPPPGSSVPGVVLSGSFWPHSSGEFRPHLADRQPGMEASAELDFPHFHAALEATTRGAKCVRTSGVRTRR